MKNAFEIQNVLGDSGASDWLRHALLTAVIRDPVDAANDAEILSRLLSERCAAVLAGEVTQ